MCGIASRSASFSQSSSDILTLLNRCCVGSTSCVQTFPIAVNERRVLDLVEVQLWRVEAEGGGSPGCTCPFVLPRSFYASLYSLYVYFLMDTRVTRKYNLVSLLLYYTAHVSVLSLAPTITTDTAFFGGISSSSSSSHLFHPTSTIHPSVLITAPCALRRPTLDPEDAKTAAAVPPGPLARCVRTVEV